MSQHSEVDHEQERDPLIGYGFGFENRELGVESFGVPYELLTELAQVGLDFATFEAHPATTITARKIYKRYPKLEFSGGPNAEAVLDLVMAFDARDYDNANRLLSRKSDLARNSEWNVGTLLLSYVTSADARAVELLAKAGIGVGVQTHLGMTSLHWAAALGNVEIVRLLVEGGAPLEMTSWFLVTPGELAAFNHHREVEHFFSRELGSAIECPSLMDLLRRMRH